MTHNSHSVLLFSLNKQDVNIINFINTNIKSINIIYTLFGYTFS
ncbi:hypothetical protein T190607A02C_120099 [Tenacibaculum sp. 190524A02b]